jgi:hypothetical protein
MAIPVVADAASMKEWKKSNATRGDVDVGVANLEKRLGAVFEYLRCFDTPGAQGGAEPAEEFQRCVLSSAVKDALEVRRSNSNPVELRVQSASS